MEDLFQIYGASTKQEVFEGIFSKVKQSQTLPAAWVFGLCHGNAEKNSSLLLENISYKCARILSAERPHICSSSHNYRSMGTGQWSQLLLQPRFKWNCGKFNEKQFACPHTLAEEEKKIDVIFFIGSRSSTTLFLYASRMFISIADMCGYVYTPEVYPTSMRGIGLGACSGAARIGCMITPFVAMVSKVT